MPLKDTHPTHTHTHTHTLHWALEEKREGRAYTHTHLSLCESYLDSLYPESQGGRWAYGLPPLHVSGFGHHLLLFLLGRRRLRVDLDHFLIHVRSRGGLLASLGQLFLEVGPEAWEEKEKQVVGGWRRQEKKEEKVGDRHERRGRRMR